jgi:hypothetical protein
VKAYVLLKLLEYEEGESCSLAQAINKGTVTTEGEAIELPT